MDSRPVGVFDSGLGGLTVLRKLKDKLPNEAFVYLGDTARVPYGTRSRDTVVEFSLQDAYFLAGQNVKCIVIACNTASALAAGVLRRRMRIPIFDVIEAGCEVAVAMTVNGKIGVVGTRGTIASHAHRDNIFGRDSGMKVFECPAPLLVPAIEEGELNGKLVELLIDKYCSRLRDKRIDTLILGCTHFPLARKMFEDYFGSKVKIVDPGLGVAEEVSKFLEDGGLLVGNKRQKDEFYVTDKNQNFENIASMFFGENMSAKVKKTDL